MLYFAWQYIIHNTQDFFLTEEMRVFLLVYASEPLTDMLMCGVRHSLVLYCGIPWHIDWVPFKSPVLSPLFTSIVNLYNVVKDCFTHWGYTFFLLRQPNRHVSANRRRGDLKQCVTCNFNGESEKVCETVNDRRILYELNQQQKSIFKNVGEIILNTHFFWFTIQKWI